jgi:hypothetical protein
MIGDWVSFLSGSFLLVMGALVMVAYRPRREWWKTPHGTLGMAIFLGFLAAVTNTAYWQVFGQWAVEFLGIMSVTQLRAFGDWIDLIVKGGAGVAGVLHLRALRLQLPEDERDQWMGVEMPWYPSRRWCLVKLCAGLKKERDQ